MLSDEDKIEEDREQAEAKFGRITEDRLPVVWKQFDFTFQELKLSLKFSL